MTPTEELKMKLVEAVIKFTTETGVLVKDATFGWYPGDTDIKEGMRTTKLTFR